MCTKSNNVYLIRTYSVKFSNFAHVTGKRRLGRLHNVHIFLLTGMKVTRRQLSLFSMMVVCSMYSSSNNIHMYIP